MATKKIEEIIQPGDAHYVGDGFRVHNFIPGEYKLSMKRMDPFIMLDYNAKFHFPASKYPKGVGVHPHRGFETVTIAYKGKVAHQDSSGGGGVIGEGDVQWMTAASGVLHKEYHEESFSRTGGDFHMVQLWVNLPAKDKMSAPKYQGITNDQISVYRLPDHNGKIEVIAGQYRDVLGTASTFTPIHLMNAKLNEGGKADFAFPAAYNTALLVIEGQIKVNGTFVPADNFVLFENSGEEFTVEALEKAVVLIMSGQPIQEPIVAYGPFVMNSNEEIRQAFNDYNAGKFGYLAD